MSSTYGFPMRAGQLQDGGLVPVGPPGVNMVAAATAVLHTMVVPDATYLWLTGMFVEAEPQNPPFDDIMRNLYLWIDQGSQRVWPYTEGSAAIFGTPAVMNISGMNGRQTSGGVWIPVMMKLYAGTWTWRLQNNSLIPIHASIKLLLTADKLLTSDEPPEHVRGTTLDEFVTSPRMNPMAPAGTPLIQDPVPGGPNQAGIGPTLPWQGVP